MRFERFQLIVLALAVFSPAHADERPQLSLPLACEPHKTCFIQNLVDLDPGAGVRDYACGSETYEAHTGVDFRLLSAAAAAPGVAVLAAAEGVVKGTRDGVPDIFDRDNKADDIKGRECGNGVLIEHGAGWETQYCHMKQGSLSVSMGQAVKRGDRLGDVGFSGKADFAHVHLSVRHDGKVVDPFLPDSIGGACQIDAKSPGLWMPEAAAKFPYRSGEILSGGFAGEPPDHRALEVDHTKVVKLSATSPALLFYGRFINLRAGDRVRVVINGPGGALVEELSAPLERNQATYLSFAGKKRRDNPWTGGHYEGRVELVREGAVIATTVGEATVAAAP